jgi:hypothetical protein
MTEVTGTKGAAASSLRTPADPEPSTAAEGMVLA